jgi:hypothetical protein
LPASIIIPAGNVFKSTHSVNPLNSPTGLLNGANDYPFQVTNSLFNTPYQSMASTDLPLTIARLHYHSGRQCL